MYNYGNPWQTQLQDMQKQLVELQTKMSTPSPQPYSPVNTQSTTNITPQIQKPQYSVPIVHGYEGAKSLASTMPFSSSVVSMDADDVIFYFIATDANGVPTIVAYDGVKREETPIDIPTIDYVSKSDYDKLETKVKDLANIVNNLSKEKEKETISDKTQDKAQEKVQEKTTKKGS